MKKYLMRWIQKSLFLYKYFVLSVDWIAIRVWLKVDLMTEKSIEVLKDI